MTGLGSESQHCAKGAGVIPSCHHTEVNTPRPSHQRAASGFHPTCAGLLTTPPWNAPKQQGNEKDHFTVLTYFINTFRVPHYSSLSSLSFHFHWGAKKKKKQLQERKRGIVHSWDTSWTSLRTYFLIWVQHSSNLKDTPKDPFQAFSAPSADFGVLMTKKRAPVLWRSALPAMNLWEQVSLTLC